MKTLYLFLSGCLLLSLTANATNTDYKSTSQKPFIFIENGVEYAVFSNGEFDFNIIRQPTSGVSINTRNINISFNSGYHYEPYIKKDRYGAIVQIERTPIYYNHYGKVTRIGNVNINYNYQGWVSNIGNLNIYYTSYGAVHNRRGYVNRYNINYRPCYQSYQRPVVRRTIVYNKPYRNNTVVKRSYGHSTKKQPNRKYSNQRGYSQNKQRENNSKELKKQDRNKKESYRENSNSYRRTSNNTKYVKASNDDAKKNKKR
ncbi:hypothetical protein AXE80_02750 [Wenyingzhuangia fucanilytica]|uniref:Uncharacterized protein n=1 Tax=Wenyingzhuangia fucanilytica TaxID=1790137 RepID=A0A1B1Y3G0_9FLAO|nr:hypothetical protein [Wenyingzhuangia fucanilytica]ANW95269.1 hypothetical protein AXE80_02750 [Wenyingzhuangia fucanilytica]